MTYGTTWKRPARLACTRFDLVIRLRCVRNWCSLGCWRQEHISNTLQPGFSILIVRAVFTSAGFTLPRLPSIRVQCASFDPGSYRSTEAHALNWWSLPKNPRATLTSPFRLVRARRWIVWSRKWNKRAFRLSADHELRETDTMKP